MAIYTNVVQEFRKDIEAQLSLNDVIDPLISQQLIDEKLYNEIWGNQTNRVGCLLDVILKDANRCSKFIDILGTISHLKSISQTIKESIEKIHKMIVIGGFPEFSLNYVVRNSVADTIKKRALDLNPKGGSTLVVHGLPGFGKSCLVNQVLQTRRFFDVSGGIMFWINLGEYNDTTAVINPLWNLYLTAVQISNQTPLLHRPDDLKQLQNEVKRVFLHDSLVNSYIILDDVKSSEVLNVFKLHCKTIVTTQDKNVGNTFMAAFVQVTTGFTKKESLELLRKSLDTDKLCFNDLANKIHILCDGCPMLLNIIASILKDSREEALSTDIIWQSIIDEIMKNKYVQHPTTMKVIDMIELFVTRLHPEVQKCFHSLAMFPKHVNIRPEILMKLWDKTYFSVRQIMVELESKSLIVSFYNNDLRTYIYSIHSLVRTYLVKRANVDIKCYHRKLMLKCDDLLTKSSADDPIANYIFGYYGYHAKNGELFDKFERYFDLRFIENKIKRVGSADLLTDFETYKDLITKKQPLLQRKLKDYIKFVNSYSAHLHISPETNIVQFAFFNDNNCVYEEAKRIASNNPDQLYFKLEPYSGIHKNFPILKTKNAAVCTCFVNSKEVLVGTESGTIEVKSFDQYQHKAHRFEGHTEEVFHLQLHPTQKSFLSISRDKTAKLWRLIEELDPQSPKLKQTNWKNLHSPDENIQPHKTFKMQSNDRITCAAFPRDGSLEIVTGSAFGKITKWNVKCATVLRETALGLPILRISYSHDSQHIIYAYDGKVYISSRDNLLYQGQFVILEHISDLILIPEFEGSKEVAVICTRQFQVWDYASKRKTFSFETQGKIVCCVLSGEFLLLATRNHFYLYNTKNRNVVYYKNDYGEPSSLHMLPDRIAFTCLDKESVERCELLFEPSENPLVYNPSLFDCHWKDSLPIYFIINPENKIDIFNGRSNILTDVEIQDRITCATFSICGKCLIFGTATGQLCVYNYKNRTQSCIQISNQAIELVKCFASKDDTGYLTVLVCKNKIFVRNENTNSFEIDVPNTVIEILFLQNQLITIDKKGRFTISRLFENRCTEWANGKYENVVISIIHKEKKLLAIVNNENDKFLLRVFDWNVNVTLNSVFEKRFLNRPICAAFSSSGKLLAIGCEDGEIKVFHLENNSSDVLLLHKQSVEKLLFAPNFESILVSLGDQIAWWNLESFEEASNKSPKQKLLFNFDPWQEKKLHDTVPYLLTSTNLNGKQLQYISASKDFRSFLVIDIDGNIFKMDIIDP